MKLVTFRPPRARAGHFGVLLDNGRILDLSALKRNRGLPRTLHACIRGGADALARVARAKAEAERRKKHKGVFEVAAVELLPPLIPGKIMAIGKNYSDHAAEIGEPGYSRPNGFIKLTSSVTSSGAAVRKPRWTEQLDYENELAVVMADACCDVPADSAYDHVFGYTIMLDLSARDVQLAERKEGNINIGKNFPGSAPLGPWVVTRDEIADPHRLRLRTRVNGEIRQDASTALQIHKIPTQIAWYSHAGFEPGDIVSTGSPAGTAIGYKGPGSWYLRDGDEIECEIEGIGVLLTRISE